MGFAVLVAEGVMKILFSMSIHFGYDKLEKEEGSPTSSPYFSA